MGNNGISNMKSVFFKISSLMILLMLLFRTVLAAEIRCDYLLVENDVHQSRRQLVAAFQANPVYQKNLYPQIVAEVVPELETVRYYQRPEKAVQNPQVQVLLLHGFGADYSRGLSMAMTIRMLSESAVGSKSDTVKALRGDENYIPIHAEAIDLPGVGGGPQIDKLDSLNVTVDWLAAYIRQMKARQPGIPVYVLARSGSPFLVTEVARRYPDHIKGIIPLSALRPGDPDALSNSYAALLDEAANPQKPFEVNKPVMDRVIKLLGQVSWTPEYFAGIKALFLTGSADRQVTQAEREFYLYLSSYSPNILFYNVVGAEHNALDSTNNAPAGKEEGRKAYRMLFKFINDIERGRSIK